MHCLKKDFYETREKSDETMAETRCYARRQISEMEDKMYAKTEKTDKTRRASRQQTAQILSEEKYKLAEVRQIASKNMAVKMAYMGEKSAEVRQVIRRKIFYMEEKS